MTDDTLIRLRTVNPVPQDPGAPPIDRVLALIATEAERAPLPLPRPRPRRRWTGALVPSLGVTVALAVAIIALIAIGHGTHRRTGAAGTHDSTAPDGRAVPSRPVVSLPAGGMPGVVQLWGSVLSSSGQGIVSFEQCNPCHAPAAQRFADWIATTTDAGVSWSVRRQPFYLFDPQFGDRQDVWGDGQSGGTLVNGVWASHDAGRTWTRVATPRSNEPGTVSVAAGTAWVTSPYCVSGCTMATLRGAAHGSTLTPTSAQPAPKQATARIVGTSDTTAYLEVYGARPRHLATHDGGRSWSDTGTACSNGFADEALTADGPDSLWEQCLIHRNRHVQFVLAHSVNGGRTWTAEPLPVGLGGLFELRPVGGEAVWAITDAGVVLRTLDGGRSWQTVLDAGPRAVLMAANAGTALVVRAVGRGHVQHHAANTNLVAYRTSDGGAHWMGTTVVLPAR